LKGQVHTLDAAAVAKLLQEIGQRSALRIGNPYRARAYTRAAENLLALTVPLGELVAQGRLREIPGVGIAIADIIAKLHKTGSHPMLAAMRKEVPASVLELVEIPGLRPDKVLKIHRELGISSVDDLEQAARADRLRPLKGLGAALQSKILRGIEIRRQGQGRRHLHRAAMLLESAKQQLRQSELNLTRMTAAGDFRRGCELVAELALVVETARLDGAPRKLPTSSQLSIYLTDRRRAGATLLLATGSQTHLDGLRSLAAGRGMILDAAGLRLGNKVVASRTEKEIYAALGLPYIEPELREGRGEIELARQRKLRPLVTDADIRGILHAHTDRSDGADNLETMAEATRARGYGYFGVADHSRSAHYAGGLSLEAVAEQRAEADRLNDRYGNGFRVFKGIESDILLDGSLDYPDEVLAQFDLVVASVHGRFKLPREEQTARIIKAVANPYTTILGHMTGRQLLRRPGYDVDIEKVLEACAKHGVAVEVNANPWRLDLDWRWHQRALELGCMMSINPDAHSTAELELTHWGVEMARKGGVPKERVLNCLDLTSFTDYLMEGRPRRKSRGRQGTNKPSKARPGPRTRTS
jgi:DNA polymerase (family 10)